ncbi:tRNA (adenosine(37)-N6)-dimethylallyltransferase MiaA [candidate division KSB1 bacterium]|nr:tRNA (adenosine(37)-N6)-dimethylallyltransferase MiaA [candidate division KSB1 bacterium]
MHERLPLVVLVGPTAIGKTQMAFELFQHFENIEIVSADSRQIFRFMDIGTAKPSIDELKKYPHHCIDIKYPDEYFSAGEFGNLARTICRSLSSKEKLPLVVGGSGLYIRSLVDGLFKVGDRNPEIKTKLEAEEHEFGLEKLYAQLLSVDPQTAAKIHRNDRQRILRALEVYLSTGESISDLREKSKQDTGIDPEYIGLIRNRGDLYKNIEERVDKMVASGLINEVIELKNKNYTSELQSQKTVGYSEIHDFLDGKFDKKTAIDLIKQNTRRFAKHQLTWFKKNKYIQWLSVDTDKEWEYARSLIIEKLSNHK